MRYTYPNGSIVDFHEPYRLTTLGGLSIPDDLYGFYHPYVIMQLDSMTSESLRGRIGAIRWWANMFKNNIAGSVHRSYINEMLESFGLGFTRDGLYDWEDEERLDSDNFFLVVSDRSRPRRQVRPFVLLEDRSNEEIEDSSSLEGRFFYAGVSTFAPRAVLLQHQIQSQQEENSGSHWERLMNYRFTPPDMTFLKTEREAKTHLYFGMELELSTALSPKELQLINTTIEPIREHWFFLKQDSSVTGSFNSGRGNGDCMEMVTVPMTPKRMRQEWKILFDKLDRLIKERNLNWTDVFDMSTTLTNGIHIHVSKDAFVQNASIHDHRHKFRFIAAFNQWESSMQDWLQKISKRPEPLRNSRYCYIHPGLDGRTLARRLRDGPTHDDRHSACHESSQTVEVRIFQGIVDLPHILSCVDMVEAMFEFTQYAPLHSYGAKFPSIFSSFVMKHERFKHAKEVLAQCV